MDMFSRLSGPLSDSRLGFNLIAIHGAITLTVLVSLILRRLIMHGGSRLGQWTGLKWLTTAGEEAAKRARIILFWLTIAGVGLSILAGALYHLAGRDIRLDLWDWYQDLTITQLTRAGFRLGVAAAAFVAAWVSVRSIRRLWPGLEAQVISWVGLSGNEKVVGRISSVLRWYTITLVRLAAVWFIGRVLLLEQPYDGVFGFIVRVFTFLVLARLLTLSSHILIRVASDAGDRYLSDGKLKHYWESVTRLFPLGQRCFDSVAYVFVALLCLRELAPAREFARFYGLRIIACIGILFLTRVAIELFQVLLAEAFGLNNDDGPIDQKKLTLAPLLNSVSQYVLYFGAALWILDVIGINTTPFLAVAGFLGLAVGLGAQNLVSDLVSGFFILFENQFLVGDYIRVGDAAGRVEAVGIRVTQIRDEQGKLHIIPNGQIKGIISYSKGYVNAVVDLKVSSGTNLEEIFRAMAEAGRRLRQKHHEVIADTQIHGLIELNTSDMTIRAVTKLKPGTHGAMQNEYRRILKEVMDQNNAVNRPAMAA
jgi:small conductance mechanosensitive channel